MPFRLAYVHLSGTLSKKLILPAHLIFTCSQGKVLWMKILCNLVQIAFLSLWKIILTSISCSNLGLLTVVFLIFQKLRSESRESKEICLGGVDNIQVLEVRAKRSFKSMLNRSRITSSLLRRIQMRNKILYWRLNLSL